MHFKLFNSPKSPKANIFFVYDSYVVNSVAFDDKQVLKHEWTKPSLELCTFPTENHHGLYEQDNS